MFLMSEVPLYHYSPDSGKLPCRGTSKTRKRIHLGPYCGPMPRVLKGSSGGGRFMILRYPCTTQGPENKNDHLISDQIVFEICRAVNPVSGE